MHTILTAAKLAIKMTWPGAYIWTTGRKEIELAEHKTCAFQLTHKQSSICSLWLYLPDPRRLTVIENPLDLALIVDRTAAGYSWALLVPTEDKIFLRPMVIEFERLLESSHAFTTYEDALEDGVAWLKRFRSTPANDPRCDPAIDVVAPEEKVGCRAHHPSQHLHPDTVRCSFQEPDLPLED